MSKTTFFPLSNFRVTLHEEAGDKFQLVFDCQAEDADHAAEQAQSAYPGCEILNAVKFDDSPLLYVIYSANEAAINDGAGYWSNAFGWVECETDATLFTKAEKERLNFPVSTGSDAIWRLAELN